MSDNNIDTLWDLDVFEMTQPDNLNALIAHYRRKRYENETGIRPKKEVGPVQKIDLAAIGIVKAPSAPVTRRF